METVKFKRLPHAGDLPLPKYETQGAAAMDLRAASEALVGPGRTVAIPTGFAVEIPAGFEMQVRSRGGLAAKHGVFVTNGPGTVDEDYRGELMVILSNSSELAYQIQRGDRIAQILIAPVPRFTIVEVDELSDSTGRGEGRFSSTGSR